MRVLVACPITPLLHELGGSVAELHRHRLGRGLGHRPQRRVQCLIRRVRFGGHREIDGDLGQRLVAFRSPQEMNRLLRRDGLLERSRVGQSDVLDGDAHQAARQVQPVFPGFEHAGQPVERRVHVGGTNALMQRRNQIEVFLAALVVEQHLAVDRGFDGLAAENAIAGHRRRQFQDVVRRASVAIRIDRDLLQQLARRRQPHHRQRPLQKHDDLLDRERVQRVHLRAREQRRDHLERRILSSGADQDDVAALHVGQERILLGAVEAVDFVDEQHRAPAQAAAALGVRHHALDFLDAAQHRAEGHEIALGDARDQPRERGLAHAGRSPQDQGLELVALDLRAQRFSRAEDVKLAHQVFQFLGTHPFGKRTPGAGRVFRGRSVE